MVPDTSKCSSSGRYQSRRFLTSTLPYRTPARMLAIHYRVTQLGPSAMPDTWKHVLTIYAFRVDTIMTENGFGFVSTEMANVSFGYIADRYGPLVNVTTPRWLNIALLTQNFSEYQQSDGRVTETMVGKWLQSIWLSRCQYKKVPLLTQITLHCW